VIAGELWKLFGAQVPFYVSSGTAFLSAALLMVGPSSKSADAGSDQITH